MEEISQVDAGGVVLQSRKWSWHSPCGNRKPVTL